MDFDGPVTKEEMIQIQEAANRAVYENIRVHTLYPSGEELEKLSYRSKIEIEGQVRIIEIPGYDTCACCAPHLRTTGEIGQIKIVGLMNYKGGVRVTMVSGRRALADHEKREKDMKEISALLSAKEWELPDAVRRLLDEMEKQKGEIMALSRKLIALKAERIGENQTAVCVFEEDLDSAGIRELMNRILDKGVKLCGVFLKKGTGTQMQYVAGSHDMDVRIFGKKLNERFSGRGGGKPEMIQGSLEGSEEEISSFFKENVNG